MFNHTVPSGDSDLADQIKKTAILKKGPSDEELKWLEKGKSADPFSYVYGLHVSGKNDKALKQLKDLGLDTSEYKVQHLHAQIVSSTCYDLAIQTIANEQSERDLRSSK
jgi:hypothetical protein